MVILPIDFFDNALYNTYMDKDDIYRPLLRKPFQRLALEIAEVINQTSLDDFDDLDACRLAIAELWKRSHPGQPLPRDAQKLLKRYDADPETKLYNPLKS